MRETGCGEVYSLGSSGKLSLCGVWEDGDSEVAVFDGGKLISFFMWP
jgi:hypothetical protein